MVNSVLIISGGTDDMNKSQTQPCLWGTALLHKVYGYVQECLKCKEEVIWVVTFHNQTVLHLHTEQSLQGILSATPTPIDNVSVLNFNCCHCIPSTAELKIKGFTSQESESLQTWCKQFEFFSLLCNPLSSSFLLLILYFIYYQYVWWGEGKVLLCRPH